MNDVNAKFLAAVQSSFKEYLIHGSRSNAKLKPLHGFIANELHRRLDTEQFTISAQGFQSDSERKIDGRYYPKNIDITVDVRSRGSKIVCGGYAVKFIMRNYVQNSNNYFENMLGETANLRSNQVPYFQILIIFDKIPHYDDRGRLQRYEILTEENLHKYVMLSKDDPAFFMHTPDKTLIIVLKLDTYIGFGADNPHISHQEYSDFYLEKLNNSNDVVKYSDVIRDNFENSVILNDYDNFMTRTCKIIEGKLK